MRKVIRKQIKNYIRKVMRVLRKLKRTAIKKAARI